MSEPGRYSDGGGLYLSIAARGSRSWVQRIVVHGKRRDIGLGGYPAVSLALARRRASENSSLVADGGDPIAERRRSEPPTFRRAALKVHEINLPTWSNKRHIDAWLATLERYAFPVIGDMPIHTVRKSDVLDVLTPIWTSKPETARRVRQRMSKVFRWAMSHDFLEFNLAGEAISEALPRTPKVTAHLRALPYQMCGAALSAIEATQASWSSRLCLQLIILTACRYGEARHATWDEIERESSTWIMPKARTKARREHKVPLSNQALTILKEAHENSDGSEFIFPSPLKPGSPISENTLTKLLKSVQMADGKSLHSLSTVHGFRSTFRIWAEEQTSASLAAKELSLAHTVGTETQRAYNRTDLLEQRRALMQEWADYVYKDPLE